MNENGKEEKQLAINSEWISFKNQMHKAKNTQNKRLLECYLLNLGFSTIIMKIFRH